MNYLYIDLEYSSFYSSDESKSGEILQFSAIAVKNGIEVGRFNEYCKPLTSKWSDEAEKVHKITKTFAMAQQHPKDMIEKFKEFLDQFDCVFKNAGWNCKNDKTYVERYISKYFKNPMNYFTKVRPQWRDGMIRAKDRVNLKSYTLSSVCEYFQIKLEAHDAIHDAEATWKVDELLNNIRSKNEKQIQTENGITEIEKRKKYLDAKYVQIDGSGVVYITENGTASKEALRVILEELWTIYVETD